MREYGFGERLLFSHGIAQSDETAEEVISSMLDGCTEVKRACVQDDKSGVDYWAYLRGNRRVAIDLKMRDAGCSRFWRWGPEVALEKWSVIQRGRGIKTGWTLDENKQTEYTLHRFHPDDTRECFLLPFQLLRVTFRRNIERWYRDFRVAIQSSGAWQSECVFVPVAIVQDAIRDSMELSVA